MAGASRTLCRFYASLEMEFLDDPFVDVMVKLNTIYEFLFDDVSC